MNRLIRQHAYLFLLLLVGLGLRVIFLNQSPPRLTQDEMSIGYNAYSILKTGKDEHGAFLPLNFAAFGDNKMPGYIYATIPFVGLFGLNEWSLKFPSILGGLALIWTSYALGAEIYNRRVGLVAAIVMTFFPWPIIFSRMALESHLALAFYGLGIYGLVRLLKKKSIFWALFSDLTLVASSYTYVTYRVLVPLIVLLFTFLFVRKIREHSSLLLPLLLVILLSLPWLFQSTDASVRMSQVSKTTDEGVLASTQEMHNFCFLRNPSFLGRWCRYLYPFPLERGVKTIEQYVQFYLPEFLFVNGDALPYLQIPGQGLFYLFSLPFYVWGIVRLFSIKDKSSQLLLGSLLIAAVPGALVGPPQSVRGSYIMLGGVLLIALGVEQLLLWSKDKKRWATLLLLTSMSFVTTRYLTEYYFIYPARNADAWYGLPNEVALFVAENEDNYKTIYVDDRYSNPYIYFAYHFKWDPAWFRSAVKLPEADTLGFRHPISVGKYYFGSEPVTAFICDTNNSYGRTLFITSQKEKWQATQTFYDFAGVHPQAFVFDTDEVRARLANAKLLNTACPQIDE